MTYRPSGQSLVPSSSENKLKTGVRETIKANFIFLNLNFFFFFFFFLFSILRRANLSTLDCRHTPLDRSRWGSVDPSTLSDRLVHEPVIRVRLTRLVSSLIHKNMLVASCLVLWNKDSTLDDALRLGKLITHILDVTNELWPCPGEFFFSLLIFLICVSLNSSIF